jgi:hypothetical protein
LTSCSRDESTEVFPAGWGAPAAGDAGSALSAPMATAPATASANLGLDTR